MLSATTLSDINALLLTHDALTSRVRNSQRAHRDLLRALPSPPQALLQLPTIRSPSPSPSPPPSPPSPGAAKRRNKAGEPGSQKDYSRSRTDLPPEKRARLARYANYIPEEETFRNDYSQRYVDGGEWPQNWVQGAELEKRFEEYPKQQRLLNLKRAAVDASSLPPYYLPLNRLRLMPPAKFDVILIDPPFYSPSFSWDALAALPIPVLAGDPSFVFMWVGSGAGEGLERGREVLARWGYRRCEDIVWVKTNKASNNGPGTDPPTSSLLTRTKQHCLMGIRGTVRRSTDNWFVHCNIDTDVIIWEGDPDDPTRKPPEMYALIESFCLGARRLEVFGRLRRSCPLRRGWVTVVLDADGDMGAVDRPPAEEPKEVDSRASSVAGGDDEAEEEVPPALAEAAQLRDAEGVDNAILWIRERWEREVREVCQVPPGGRTVVPSTPEIDALRPKSPVRNGSANNQMTPAPVNMQGGSAGGAGGMGVVMPARPMQNINPAQNLNQGGLGAYPMMGPPMRMGYGVMNPGLVPNQMQIPLGIMGPTGAMMGMGPPQVGMAGQNVMGPQGMGMMMQVPGMGMGMAMPPGMIGGMGDMNMFAGDGGFGPAFQNGFGGGGQAGFGGPQMNGGWGAY